MDKTAAQSLRIGPKNIKAESEIALLFLIVVMDDETKEMFLRKWRSRRKPLPWVFLNADGTDRVKRFYKAVFGGLTYNPISHIFTRPKSKFLSIHSEVRTESAGSKGGSQIFPTV